MSVGQADDVSLIGAGAAAVAALAVPVARPTPAIAVTDAATPRRTRRMRLSGLACLATFFMAGPFLRWGAKGWGGWGVGSTSADGPTSEVVVADEAAAGGDRVGLDVGAGVQGVDHLAAAD